MISNTNGYPTQLIPLIFVIILNGMKDFIEDFRRRKFDNTENYREILVFDNKKEIFCRKFAKDIMLGDIVKVNYS